MNKQNTKQDNDLSMPKGYKKTKIGWIPENWKLGKVSSFISKLDSGISVNCVEESPITIDNRRLLKTSSITSGVLKLSESKVPALNERDDLRCSLKAGQILVCRKNTPELVGASVFVLESRDEYYIPDLIWQSQANGNNHLLFLYYLLQTDRTRFAISCRANGSSRSMVNISKGSFLGIQVVLPSLPEQQKIAQILSTWDKAIEQTQNLIEQLKNRKKGLTQQLLTGKTRLKGFSGEWKEVQLGKHLVFHKQKSSSSDTYPVFSSSKKGLIMQSDYYGGDNRITSRDIDGFNIIPTEYATYRSRSDDGIFTFNSNNHGITGVVSKYYPVFKCIESNQNFIIQTLNYHHYKVRRYAVGTSQLVLSEKDLKQLKFNLPSHEEQNAIDNLLATADKEIKTQENHLTQLQDQKKGLMQQLLTGQKRVKID